MEHTKLKTATFGFGEAVFQQVSVNLFHILNLVADRYRLGKERRMRIADGLHELGIGMAIRI